MNIYEGMSWDSFLAECVRGYKAAHPDTGLSEWEIMTSLMEHLVDSGLVKKNEAGRYMVPRVIGRLQ